MQCQIVKCTRTSLGPAWPGPKLVELPDDEARRLAEQGVVTIRDTDDGDAHDTQEREQRPRLDRQMRRRQTR